MPLSPGTKLSNYEIKSILGTGGMGEVYLAQDTKLKRPVAIKFLHTDCTPSRERLSRFRREAYAASSLNHPNILTIYEIGEADERRFISSEFVEGRSLRESMSRGRMELIETLDLAIQVASALAAAHHAGIVHRDIKPENIMIRDDGLVKVLDFGLAKLLNQGAQESGEVDRDAATQTRADSIDGQVLGTVRYMSPEQTRGPDVDGRSDIWSLGVVLYEMLTGTLPFKGETNVDTIAAILRSNPLPMQDHVPEVPREIQRIVTRMLCKDRSGRYQHSHDLLFSLKELKQELELRARISGNIDRSVSSVGHASIVPHVSVMESLVTGINQRKKSVTFILLMILIGVAGFIYFTRQSPATPIDSLAVLPFTNDSGDQDLEYLSDGLSESVVNRLSQSSQLRLIASNSSFRYKGAAFDSREAARALGAKALVIGSVKQRPDGIRVVVELVDARDMTRLWGASYDRNTANLEDIVIDISREVSARLRLSLTNDQQKRVTESSTNDADAYQLYLKGRFSWNKLSEDGLRKSVDFFTQAIEKDPKYARAYAGLANAYSALGANYLSPQETYPKARYFANKALELDDTVAEAHYAMAVVNLFDEWNLREADKELSRTLELNPSFAPAFSMRSSLNLARGQHKEAVSSIERAVRLDPFSLIFNVNLGSAYYYGRQYKRAQEQFSKALEIEPKASYLQAEIGVAFAYMGASEQAFAACQKAIAVDPDNPSLLSSVGIVHAINGKTKDAETTIENLKLMSKRKYVQPYHIALVYAALNKKDEAFTWLDKVVSERSALLCRLKVDPTLDNIRSDPRYAALLKRTRLDE